MPSVFLSYSHKDEVWKDRLKTHLGVLDLETWDDRRIEAGANWFEEIQDAMAHASVAVLLISADFLTSRFIRGEEVPTGRRLRGRAVPWNRTVVVGAVHRMPSGTLCGRPG
jgi:hypothetical protein